MDLQISYPILVTFFCFLLVILNSKKSNKLLPPGPWKLPLIGNMHHMLGSLPHVALANLANKYGPLMHLQLGETSNIIVSSTEVAKEIFKTHDLIFSNRPHVLAARIITYNNIDIGFAPYGSYWRELRKICTVELLTAKRVQSFRSIREEEVSTVINDISTNEGSIVNLSEKFMSLSNSIIARAAFGEKSRDQEAFLSSLKVLMKVISGFSLADFFPSLKILQVITGMKAKVERIHRENDRILENIIKDYKERKQRNNQAEEENLLDVLFKIQQENYQEVPLALDNIKAIILDIFIAGSESSSTVVEWAMAELVRNPKIMEKAQTEVRRIYGGRGYVDESDLHQLTYLNLIIKETLRFHPPSGLLLPRENHQSCVINGYEIPPNTKTMVNVWAMGRDPKIWTEPETFKPERFIDSPIDYKGTYFEYIPFGAGRRICPGIAFAMPTIELPLASLLFHFDWKLPNGLKHEELDMSEYFASGIRRKGNLSLIPIRYNP